VLGKDKGYREKETAKKSSKMSPLPLPKVFLRKLFVIDCCFSLHYETTQKKSFLKLKFHSRFFTGNPPRNKEGKRIYESKTTRKEIAKRFRVKSSFAAFKPPDKSVQEVVWGYRGEEKPRFASSGFSAPQCSATSGAKHSKNASF
jgi:hypothetical protein